VTVPLQRIFKGVGHLGTGSSASFRPRPHQTAKTYALVVGQSSIFKGSYPSAASFSIVAVADSFQAKLSNAFLRLLEVLKDAVSVKDIQEAIEAGGAAGVFRVLDIDNRLDKISHGAGLQPNESSLVDILQQVFKAGAEDEINSLKKVEVHKATAKVGVEMVFDLLNPEAIAFLQSYTFDLIQQISQQTKLAIQDVVTDAFQHGGHPYTQAQTIKSFIGLTQSQTRAVLNFRKMLESGDPTIMSGILQRALRDKRFDSSVLSAIQQGAVLPQDKIDAMVGRYQQRYLKYRAEMIARTETLRAANEGARNTRKQAVSQGLLDPDRTRQKWVITKDDRTCELCQSVPKQNPKGIPLDGMFSTSFGPVEGPPLHPHCRCVTVLTFVS